MATIEATGKTGVTARDILRRCRRVGMRTDHSQMRIAGGDAGRFRAPERSVEFTDAELVPVRMFVVASKIGGQVIGAFDGQRTGQLLRSRFRECATGTRICTRRCWRCARQYRNAGLGRRMKLYQREDALARGIELMEWTFDPLEIKNAYLNIEKLGAIARRYNVNQYGITSSPLQGGLPSDRLVAEWWMKSRRVEMVLAKQASACVRHANAASTCRPRSTNGRRRRRPANRRSRCKPRNREQFTQGIREPELVSSLDTNAMRRGDRATFCSGRRGMTGL